MKIFAFLNYACDPIQCLPKLTRANWENGPYFQFQSILFTSSCFLHDWIQYCFI